MTAIETNANKSKIDAALCVDVLSSPVGGPLAPLLSHHSAFYLSCLSDCAWIISYETLPRPYPIGGIPRFPWVAPFSQVERYGSRERGNSQVTALLRLGAGKPAVLMPPVLFMSTRNISYCRKRPSPGRRVGYYVGFFTGSPEATERNRRSRARL